MNALTSTELPAGQKILDRRQIVNDCAGRVCAPKQSLYVLQQRDAAKAMNLQRFYRELTGRHVSLLWGAAAKFREAGAEAALVERLQLWGMAYTDRAARLQYH